MNTNNMRNNLISLYITIALLPLTTSKVGRVKYYEIFYIVLLFLFSIYLLHGKKKQIRLNRASGSFLVNLLSIINLLIIFTLFSFISQDFYIPINANGLLERIYIANISRFTQYFLIIFVCLYILTTTKTIKIYQKILLAYIIVGVSISFYSIISYFLYRFGIDLGGAYNSDRGFGIFVRTKGTFVEGGPFGLYTLSVLIVFLVYQKLFKIQRIRKLFISITLFLSLILSYSKAAFLAIFILFTIIFLFGRYKRQAIIYVLPTICLISLATKDYIIEHTYAYIKARELAPILATRESKQEDGNFAYGRVAGSFIVPNMIMHNPITGIGIGNYPLLRNNPKYRDVMPEVSNWDLSGLGWGEFFAEGGIFVGTWTFFLFFKNFLISKKNNLGIEFDLLALFQPIAHLMGLQLTFFYPWVITVFFLLSLKFVKIRQTDRSARAFTTRRTDTTWRQAATNQE